MKAQKIKIKGDEGSKCQNEGWEGKHERQWRARKQKWKEMKAIQKAKMKSNDGWEGKNERKWNKREKVKIKGNDGPKGQNERQWKVRRFKRPK